MKPLDSSGSPRGVRLFAVAAWWCVAACFSLSLVIGAGGLPAAAAPLDEESDEEAPRGVRRKEPGISPGYTLIDPFSNGSSYLVDADGRVLHAWESRYRPGLAPYLLPNGNLLRGIQVELESRFEGGGISGGLQEFDWDGNLLWEFHLASDLHYHHHDVEPLPNGNILMIAWEWKSKEEAVAAGRRPDHAGDDGLWPEVILEVEALHPYGARVVWKWHVWDHLIQDTDPEFPNYGVVADHPERIDINGDIPREEESPAAAMTDQERARLIALGYLDESAADTGDDGDGDDAKIKRDREREKRDRERGDWLHLNGIDYNAELDQIVMSSWHMNEIWIVDHGTTTEDASGSTGGRAGHGGDVLYRWGNPQTYDAGSPEDRKLFHQHDPQWVPPGYPGSGNITIFNNGRRRGEEEYSTVLEITPPLRPDGTYAREEGEPFGPSEPAWEYDPGGDDRFYASFISGAHRLRNGNTLICSGPQGRVFEVTPAGDIVWDYHNPFGALRGDAEPNEMTYAMFRATRIVPEHPALRDRLLAPLDPQPKTVEQLLAESPEPGVAASGWKPLFGEEIGLTRWKDVNCAPGETFRLQPNPDDDSETILICSGEPTGFLRSDRMYENFILELEWRHVEEPGNAGIFLFADPLPAVGGPFTRAIEVQVCNLGDGDWFTSHGDIFPIWGATMTPDPRFRVSGSRSMPKEDSLHAKPTGEWNHYRITAVDGSVTLEVNGHLVTAGSQCSPSRGYLCLESEGGEVHFRDLRIWELPAGSHAAGAARTGREASSHRSLYNGLDLSGFTVESGEWRASDWRLTCEAEPGEIRVELPGDPSHLFFDFKREGAPEGEKLPLRLGGARFDAAGEEPGAWNRVHVSVGEAEVSVELNGRRQTVPRDALSELTLDLVNDGMATEFCSLFVEAE